MRKRRHTRSRIGLWSAFAIAILLLAYLAVLGYARPQVSGEELRLDTFVSLAEEGRIQNARILDADGIVTGAYLQEDGSSAAYHAPYFRAEVLRERLAQLLLDERIPTSSGILDLVHAGRARPDIWRGRRRGIAAEPALKDLKVGIA